MESTIANRWRIPRVCKGPCLASAGPPSPSLATLQQVDRLPWWPSGEKMLKISPNTVSKQWDIIRRFYNTFSFSQNGISHYNLNLSYSNFHCFDRQTPFQKASRAKLRNCLQTSLLVLYAQKIQKGLGLHHSKRVLFLFFFEGRKN